MPRCLLIYIVVFFVTPSLFSQPTAPSARSLLDLYKAERAETAKIFTAAELAAADEQAAKAEAELAAGNTTAAIRYATDARWQLPFQPNDIPANVVRVLGAGRLRHGDRVNSIAYSPDGSKLVSGSRDGTVRVWDVGNGRELLVYRGHEAAKFTPVEDRKAKVKTNLFRVAAVSFSPDGKQVASCGEKEIQIWEVGSGKLITTLKGHTGEITGMVFAHKNPNRLASVGDDKRLIVWDFATGKPLLKSDEQTTRMEAVAFAREDNQVAGVDSSGALVVFTITGDKLKLGFGGAAADSKGLSTVAFSANGSSLFIGGMDKQIKQIAGPIGTEATVGNTIRRFGGHSDEVNSLALTPDGKQLVSLDSGQMVLVWDLESGKKLRAFPGDPAFKKGICLAVRPDGRQLAIGYETGAIRLIPFAQTDEHRGHTEAKENLWTVSISPDRKSFAAAGADRVVRLYDTATGKMNKELSGHKLGITAVAYLNGNTLASASGDKIVKIWDLAAGTAKNCEGHTLAVLAVASNASGSILVSGSADKTVRCWDPVSGQAKWKWEGRSIVCGLAVSTDGKRIAVGTADGKLNLLSTEATEPKLSSDIVAHTSGVSCVAFSPDSEQVATCGGDGLVKTWSIGGANATAPVQLTIYTAPFKPTPGAPVLPVTSIAYSPDGKFIVGSGAEGVVRIWDVLTGNENRSLRGHAGWVTAVAFSADGKSVLSCGIDRVARLFELPSIGTNAGGHRGVIQCVAVSRDGKLAATGGSDRSIKIWDLATGREIATLTGDNSTRSGERADGIWSVGFIGVDQIAGCGKDKKLRIWSIQSNKLLSERSTSEVIYSLSASEDGKSICGAWVNASEDTPSKSGFDLFSDSPTPRVTVWNSKTAADAISAAASSPDADLGISGGKDGVLRLWDLKKQERLGGEWPLFQTTILDVGLTNDRKTVVAIDVKGAIKIADIGKRETLATVQLDNEPRGVIVSPTSDKFATLSGNGEVKAWDLKGKELRSWKLPHVPNCAVFTTDGKRLIIGNQDGTAFVLDLP
jgi:WD40 repeat protein